MDRLTYKSCMGDFGSAKKFESEFAEKCALRNALGKYEELGYKPEEIQKYIPKYPIGSYVYKIYKEKVFALRVIGFSIEHGIRKCKLYINHNEEIKDGIWSLWIDNWFDELDKSIFATKEDAEFELSRMKNERKS